MRQHLFREGLLRGSKTKIWHTFCSPSVLYPFAESVIYKCDLSSFSSEGTFQYFFPKREKVEYF